MLLKLERDNSQETSMLPALKYEFSLRSVYEIEVRQLWFPGTVRAHRFPKPGDQNSWNGGRPLGVAGWLLLGFVQYLGPLVNKEKMYRRGALKCRFKKRAKFVL